MAAIILEHIKLPENKSMKRKHQDPSVNDVMMTNKKKKKRIKLTLDEKQELLVKAGDQHRPDDVEEDRLTNLPEPIKLHILSFLNNYKDVVRTSLLSKSWVSLWTWIPVINFDSRGTKLRDFDKIVTKVLASGPDKPVKLDKLTFNRKGFTSAKILDTVLGYALSNGVKEVEVSIEESHKKAWPDCLHSTSSDLLTCLKLTSYKYMDCEFLGQRSAGLFKKLTNLYLGKVVITDLDPFSGFPALEKLTLYQCWQLDHHTLNIRASQLSTLTIQCCHRYLCLDHCELSTPKLKIFKFQGCSYIPVFVTPQGLPVLEEFVFCQMGLKFDEPTFHLLISTLPTFHSAKSLTVSLSIVVLLSRFSIELMLTGCSPFRGLKILKLHLYSPEVVHYLLQYSPDAKVSEVDPCDSNYIWDA